MVFYTFVFSLVSGIGHLLCYVLVFVLDTVDQRFPFQFERLKLVFQVLQHFLFVQQSRFFDLIPTRLDQPNFVPNIINFLVLNFNFLKKLLTSQFKILNKLSQCLVDKAWLI